MKVVIVEGLIGSGKTSLLKMLESHFPNACCIYEPVDLWKESGELDTFYKGLEGPDPSLTSYVFQTYAFITRINRIKEAFESNPTAEIYFLERSIFSDKHLFMRSLFESNIVKEREMERYNQWWDMWSSVVVGIPIKPDVFIYLNPDIDECMERLRIRDRSEEKGVTKEYQENLKKYHDEFLGKDMVTVGSGSGEGVPCLNLQTNSDFRSGECAQELTQQIKDFLCKY